MTRLPKLKISWRRGKQYTSPITLGGGGHNDSELTDGLPLRAFGGPDGLFQGVEEFEAEAIFLGGPLDELASVEEHCAAPVTALYIYMI